MPATTCQDDPDWLLAHAEYLFPDADDPDARFAARVRAAMRMHEIEHQIRDGVNRAAAPRV